jgi:photosystem II stability/assembly factor-like uncharacterized protein
MVSASEGWAVGNGGVLIHYADGVWKQVPSPTRENLSGVTFTSASEGWAVGDQHVILHFLNGGWSLYQR